jgi:hypothetical protein
MVSSWPSLFGRQWSMALLCTLAFVALPGVPAAAATAKEMYEAALVREQSVRLAPGRHPRRRKGGRGGVPRGCAAVPGEWLQR